MPPAYGVYVSQIIQYARACSEFDQFWSQAYGKLFINKLLLQEFQQSCLKTGFCKFYDRYNDLVNPNNLTLSQMRPDTHKENCYM